MDITKFVHSNRDRAFLVGDYSSYRTTLSRQLLKLRRRLHRTTPKNSKAPSTKTQTTSSDIGSNHAFVHLELLTAERAWAHAMSMKGARGEDSVITGSARQHISSRLQKATKQANHLVTLLGDNSSGANQTDLLEAKAYATGMAGVYEFEKHATQPPDSDAKVQREKWETCLLHFSAAHVIYNALLHATKADVYKEVLGGSIDPSIRYAAYQSRLPRSVALSQIAKQRFPRSDAELVKAVEALNPAALSAEEKQAKVEAESGETREVPTTVSWRGRSAPIADASIGQNLASTSIAIDKLVQVAEAPTGNVLGPHTPKVLAAAFDPVLTAAQETVESTRRTITELLKEGIAESDSRMQDLRVTDLAVNYELVAWRIGRNRVLISSAPSPGQTGSWSRDDGLDFQPATLSAKKSKKKTKAAMSDVNGDVNMEDAERTEPIYKQLSRITARVALYDLTLQSLDAVSSLRGAARDQGFQSELTAKRTYFSSLRTLNIAISHQLLGQEREALALLHAANQRAQGIDASSLGKSAPLDSLKLGVTSDQFSALHSRLQAATSKQHGLVALQRLIPPLSSHPRHENQLAQKDEKSTQFKEPLINHLDQYPQDGRVDLTNLVQYPPKLEPVPVKPIFLDLAWNYIDYPGRKKAPEMVQEDKMEVDGEGDKPRKRGWFGFGR